MADRIAEIAGGDWLTIDAEAALYVDRSVTTMLCDRLPRPITLLLKRPTVRAHIEQEDKDG